MRNFVISCPFNSLRRQHIIEEFAKQQVEFEFWNCYSVDQIDKVEIVNQEALARSPLKAAEKSCLLSHVEIWKKIIEENLQYAAIFEDDVILSDDAQQFLNSSSWLESLDIDIIKIESQNKKAYLSLQKIKLSQPGYKLAKLRSYYLGSAGYILSNQGAKDLYAYLNQLSIYDHIDILMFKNFLQQQTTSIYLLNPALCIQDSVFYGEKSIIGSTMHGASNVPRRKIKKPDFSKSKREIIRLYRQISKFHLAVKIRINNSSLLRMDKNIIK